MPPLGHHGLSPTDLSGSSSAANFNPFPISQCRCQGDIFQRAVSVTVGICRAGGKEDKGPEISSCPRPCLRIAQYFQNSPVSVRGLLGTLKSPSRGFGSLHSLAGPGRTDSVHLWAWRRCASFFHLPGGAFQNLSKGPFSCGLNPGPWHHAREEPH